MYALPEIDISIYHSFSILHDCFFNRCYASNDSLPLLLTCVVFYYESFIKDEMHDILISKNSCLFFRPKRQLCLGFSSLSLNDMLFRAPLTTTVCFVYKAFSYEVNFMCHIIRKHVRSFLKPVRKYVSLSQIII